MPDPPDSTHLNMFVNPGPPGELPVSFIEPWGILNNPPIHVGDERASVRADCGDEPGIEVGGAKELLPSGSALRR